MRFLRNDFVIALLLLAAYLLTNSYVYGWDDQHLEIPLLKHLIDPSLYKGDYYVEGLGKNFTSYLYPILSKLISIPQIPSVYLILFLVSRYAMFYWVFRLWHLISGSRFAAALATLAFFLLARTEEFLYRTFSHQEFSYIFMFAGLYYFYRERYILAAFIFGIGTNFHAIYNLFPMLYLLAFLLLFHEQRIKAVFKAGIVYTIAALPFLLWQIPRSLSHKVPVPIEEWMPLYLLSCPQNFLFASTPVSQVFSSFTIFIEKFAPYLFLTALYVFHLVFNDQLRKDKKMHSIILVSWALIGVSYYFHYVHPSRFILDLNLIRVEQYVRFFLMGYTAIWAALQVEIQPILRGALAALLFIAVGVSDVVALLFLSLIAIAFSAWRYLASKHNILNTAIFVISSSLLGIFAYVLAMHLKPDPYMPLIWKKFQWAVLGVCAAAIVFKFRPSWHRFRGALLVIPLLCMFISFGVYHYSYLQAKKTGPGFWQFQRNWQDMQHFVRKNTPKDALILTPYNTDLGGFRIRSERKVLVCYRDCGIIGFDYTAAVEWNKRVQSIEPFKMITNQPVDRAVLEAILKYRVDYVVFMKYYEPKGENPVLKKIYENEVLSLFEVTLTR